MTATNFRDLLNPVQQFRVNREVAVRYQPTVDILARPVPWVDCPTCKGEGVEFAGDEDDIGDGCPTCSGTGKATVAQLLAWGSAVAQTDPEDWIEFGDQRSAVDGYRNRILGVQP